MTLKSLHREKKKKKENVFDIPLELLDVKGCDAESKTEALSAGLIK